MKKVMIFDTAVCTENVGDYIIMDAVNNQIFQLFTNDMIFHSLTHDKISNATYRLNRTSNFSFIGGTNLLSSNMNSYNQWKINIIDAFFLRDIVLMGVGWWQYQENPNLYTRMLLRNVLNKNLLHSVRDSYTEKMLKSIGISNVINTGCPTMWTLTKKHCTEIPNEKAENVVFTLTDYNKDKEKDQNLINILVRNYKKVYFWPQGSMDFEYINSFNRVNDIDILGGNLFCYNDLVGDKNISVDYVGTRLHAGIRSLQKKRRCIIIGIDNRAEEKSIDFNLNVLSRDNLEDLENLINTKFHTDVLINENNINKWKNQFRETDRRSVNPMLLGGENATLDV